MNITRLLVASALLVSATFAAESTQGEHLATAAYEIRVTAAGFTPQTLFLPARTPVVLRVANTSTEAIEFESFKLNRERVVEPGRTIEVRLPPLKPGTYDFFDDFHPNAPGGKIVVRRSASKAAPR